MKKTILLVCMLGLMVGCTFTTTPNSSGKSTTYTLDSVNPR